MSDTDTNAPGYNGPQGGAYTTEEHLKAQQEQLSASTGKPLHETAPEPQDAHAEPTPQGIGDDINADGSEHNDATGNSAPEHNDVTGDQPAPGV